MFEGDCDNDDECKGNFKCGEYNCLDMNPDSSFSTGADCCYDPNDDNFNNQVNIKSYDKIRSQYYFHLPVCHNYVRNPKQKVFLKFYSGGTFEIIQSIT